MSQFFTDTAEEVHKSLQGGSIKLSGNKVCGNLLMAQGRYTGATGMRVGDEIIIARLPKGSVIVPHLCRVEHENLGATFSVKVGTSSVPDSYGTLDLKVAGSASLLGSPSGCKPADSTEWIIATITDVSGTTVGKKASFLIAYVQP